jgi:hypothetical protein
MTRECDQFSFFETNKKNYTNEIGYAAHKKKKDFPVLAQFEN